MNKKKNSKIEKLLEQTYQDNPPIPQEFKESLKQRLLEQHGKKQHGNNIISLFNMNNRKSSTKKSLLSAVTTLPKALLYSGAGFAAVLIAGLLYGFVFFNQDEASDNNQDPQFGSLTVQKGTAEVYRDDTVLILEEGDKEEIKEGDTLKTKENTIADAETEFGRVSLSSDTSIEIEDDKGELNMGKGYAYLRTKKDKEIKNSTPNGTVIVKNGSSITDIIEEGTLLKSVSGTVKGEVEREGSKVTKEVENGKQILLTKEEIAKEAEIERDELKTVFCEHNWEKDEEENYDKGTAEDLTSPDLTVIQPENGLTTESPKIDVKAKSNEDGWAKYNGKWNSINKNEEFSYSVNLKSGENKISITIKDKSYNKTQKTIKVTRVSNQNISLNSLSANSTGIYMKWTASGAQNGHRLVVLRGPKDTSVGSTVLNISAQNGTKGWTDKSTEYGKPYYYMVKILSVGGTTLAQTGIKGTTAKNNPPETKPTEPKDPTPPTSSCTITISKALKLSSTELQHELYPHTGSNAVKLYWSVNGDCGSYNGFKVVWSQNPTPTYGDPGDSATWVSSDKSHKIVDNLTSGKWYFRVGTYDNGQVTQYSNEVNVTF